MRGVYFLANDRIADQVIAFLNSFRLYNPAIPLCLVPFAEDTDFLRTLSASYAFSVWSDEETLRVCDEISRPFHGGKVQGHYRKLAMWTGPFERFVYIDSDTVVLSSVDFVFDHLDRYAFLTSHSNMAQIRRWVWRDSIQEACVLTRSQIEDAASTGFIASRASLIDPRQVQRELSAPLTLAPHMELLCMEQPLLNYLIVTSGRPCASLYVIATQNNAWDLPQEQWAGHDIGRFESGQFTPSRARRVLLVHWAGEWARIRKQGGRIPYYELWHHYRFMSGNSDGQAKGDPVNSSLH